MGVLGGGRFLMNEVPLYSGQRKHLALGGEASGKDDYNPNALVRPNCALVRPNCEVVCQIQKSRFPRMRKPCEKQAEAMTFPDFPSSEPGTHDPTVGLRLGPYGGP